MLPDVFKDLRNIIDRIRKEQDQPDKQPEHQTLFHELLQSSLSTEEKSDRRLADEAQTVIGAGLMTTAWALTNACFYLAETPRLQRTLQAELRAAIPDVNAPDAFSFNKLEQLPYLRGCVREGIRFAHALSGRGPRVFNSPLEYDRWTIPAKTPISMTIKDLHWDETFYPTPDEFVPERWLDNPKAPDGSSLDRYFMGFGKGPRICLGLKYVVFPFPKIFPTLVSASSGLDTKWLIFASAVLLTWSSSLHWPELSGSSASSFMRRIVPMWKLRMTFSCPVQDLTRKESE